MGYKYLPDKLNTRYTELLRCTPGGVASVIRERHEGIPGYTNDAMKFGSKRHDMFEAESLKTGRLPKVFQIGLQLKDKVEHVEWGLSTEIADGIVVHSRIDSYSPEIHCLNDYKTTTTQAFDVSYAVRAYKNSMQLPVYAYVLSLHGVVVRRVRYMVEAWNKEHNEILGYSICEKPVGVVEMGQARRWLLQRAQILMVAESLYMQQHAEVEASPHNA